MGEDAGRQIMTQNDMVHHGMKGYVGEEWTDDIALMVPGGEAEDGMLNGDETHAKRNDIGQSNVFLLWYFRLYKNDKGESLNSWYYQIVKPLNHKFATNLNTITFGTQHALDPLTIVKARYDNLGKPNALIQYDWRPKSLFTI
ncbi:Eukaryotic porin/Tom40 [Artemisia annua]|uniref:Eukaryotic porin/Tom40 n=1 Tax=Artemisia annua TaxID=35608 RepID=A0A2U1MVZ2_ARTAN|nr:Eukaryotic porin/Tom40 [Artemisia annua]